MGEELPEGLSHRLEADTRKVAGQLLAELKRMFDEDPDPLGLDTVLRRDAQRLVDTLESLMADGVSAIVTFQGTTAEERADEFVRAFADRVSGGGHGLISDAAARRAAVRCAERLLRDSRSVADAVANGNEPGKISGDLLCLIYAFFFANTVSDLLTATIAEKIKLALPMLYLDPTGEVAKWIAEKLIQLIPDPCEEQEKVATKARSLADTTRALIPDSITQIMNI